MPVKPVSENVFAWFVQNVVGDAVIGLTDGAGFIVNVVLVVNEQRFDGPFAAVRFNVTTCAGLGCAYTGMFSVGEDVVAPASVAPVVPVFVSDHAYVPEGAPENVAKPG